MEFSIRAFLNKHEAAVLERMQDWADHDNYHLRRLVSEGTRPKLPWGQSVGLTHDQTLPLLDLLHADPTRYVTRSVSNHLNDITKTEPDLVLERLSDWQKSNSQSKSELTWMAKHALRGLIKSGHPGAMAQLGYAPDAPVEVSDFQIAPATLARGEAAEISVTLISPAKTPIIVDYVIDFVKANGSTAPKVSKFKVLELKPNVPVSLRKKHMFKDNATTFTLYPGTHRVHLQVNGRILATLPFDLT
jgi:3-methyladenine DNA glycosylase AlkC